MSFDLSSCYTILKQVNNQPTITLQDLCVFCPYD
jgi:hypothetical protein